MDTQTILLIVALILIVIILIFMIWGLVRYIKHRKALSKSKDEKFDFMKDETLFKNKRN